MSGRLPPCLLLSYRPSKPSKWRVHFCPNRNCRRAIRQAFLCASLLFALLHSATSQQPQSLDRTLASLHGTVRNAITGEGIARALVRVEGDADIGVLTDGDGRFSIPSIPVGPQHVSIVKPDYFDFSQASLPAEASTNHDLFLMRTPNGGHNVLIAAQMADVDFALTPAGSLRGQVQLSTGDTAQGVEISLARRVIAQGRAVWQSVAKTRVRADGSFRFGSLEEGEYVLSSTPAMDSDLDELAGAGPRWGFAASYFPDARDPSGVAPIRVTAGQEAQASLTLTLEPFQPVPAFVMTPPGTSNNVDFAVAVLDSSGIQLPYPAQYDGETRAIHANLPDGNYSLLAVSGRQNRGRDAENPRASFVLVGQVDVAVAGRPVTNLRVAITPSSPGSVEVAVMHNAGQAVGAGPLGSILVSPAQGWTDDSLMSEYATGNWSAPLTAQYTRPGSYWATAHLDQQVFCVSGLTANGADLGREPLVVGASGAAQSVQLVLRDDCATLQINLPDTLSSITAGDETFYTVYAVPDFDSTAEPQHITLRPSSGGAASLGRLTPGNYHVYTFSGLVEFAYRNPAALRAMSDHAQAVTLAPSASVGLEVEPTP